MEKNLGDKRRDGDDGVGLRKKMFLAETRAGAFGEVAGKDDEGAGLDEAGGEEGGPVVVSMMSVEDAGLSPT